MIGTGRKIVILVLILFMGISIKAQESPKYNIDFKDVSFKEAVKMAKKEGKKIFVDCYTVW